MLYSVERKEAVLEKILLPNNRSNRDIAAEERTHHYTYDQCGRVTALSQTIGSQTFTTRYAYDAVGRLAGSPILPACR